MFGECNMLDQNWMKVPNKDGFTFLMNIYDELIQFTEKRDSDKEFISDILTILQNELKSSNSEYANDPDALHSKKDFSYTSPQKVYSFYDGLVNGSKGLKTRVLITRAQNIDELKIQTDGQSSRASYELKRDLFSDSEDLEDIFFPFLDVFLKFKKAELGILEFKNDEDSISTLKDSKTFFTKAKNMKPSENEEEDPLPSTSPPRG